MAMDHVVEIFVELDGHFHDENLGTRAWRCQRCRRRCDGRRAGGNGKPGFRLQFRASRLRALISVCHEAEGEIARSFEEGRPRISERIRFARAVVGGFRVDGKEGDKEMVGEVKVAARMRKGETGVE